MPTRTTNLMELFQASIIGAIAAAAGCNVSAPVIDNGIDLDLGHELPGLEEVPLRIQLKAVTSGWDKGRTKISASMSRKRYDQMRRVSPLRPQILVIMDLPPDQDHWIRVNDPYMIAQHLCYWANLEGAPEFAGSGDTVTVSAPGSNVFDDVALCQMMARVRAGGAP